VRELVHLDPSSIDAVARRMLALLRAEGAIGATSTAQAELLTAADIARRHGVDRSWVYANADRLGAVRLGDGPKPRLRFDPERVRAALDARSPSEGSRNPRAPAAVRMRAVDVSDLVPEPADLLPKRWRDAAGLPGREATG
jgi:hypothetical protein